MRGDRSEPFLRLVAGSDGEVAAIEWHTSPSSGAVAQLWGGSEQGMVLAQVNLDGSWTVFCIDEGTIERCLE